MKMFEDMSFYKKIYKKDSNKTETCKNIDLTDNSIMPNMLVIVSFLCVLTTIDSFTDAHCLSVYIYSEVGCMSFWMVLSCTLSMRGNLDRNVNLCTFTILVVNLATPKANIFLLNSPEG